MFPTSVRVCGPWEIALTSFVLSKSFAAAHTTRALGAPPRLSCECALYFQRPRHCLSCMRCSPAAARCDPVAARPTPSETTLTLLLLSLDCLAGRLPWALSPSAHTRLPRSLNLPGTSKRISHKAAYSSLSPLS